ncbi:MAG: hypothetical protein ACUVQ1_08445 [Candidatus Kapaibacteriales bacterium]
MVVRKEKKISQLLAVGVMLLFFALTTSFAQLYLSPGVNVTLRPGAVVTINTNLVISNGSALTQNNSGSIYIKGNWTNNGTFNSGTGTVTFNGATLQSIAGSQSTTFYNLTISKSGGNLSLNTSSSVGGTLDFQSNSLIELDNGVNLTISNSSAGAIQNYGANRYIKTTYTSGMLIRSVTTSQNYYFPVGSNGYYAPVLFEASSTGTGGTYGVRTSYGQHPTLTDAHIGIFSSSSTVYLKRYWSIDTISAKINGKWTFTYNDADVAGAESELTKLGRWRPIFETTPGVWLFPVSSPNINTTTNNFEIPSTVMYAEYHGDWTLGNDYAFRRIFYSRQSGQWNDDQSWTFSSTHSGPIAGVGIYPNSAGDSVVIGGGNNGSGNHEITLNLSNPFSSPTAVGIALGTGASNTGTLSLGTNILNGQYFTMGDYSTIKIGSPDGINAIGTNLGNIQTTSTRTYNTNCIYVYNGTTNQAIGNGLPSSVYSFIVDNSGTYPNNVVTIDKDITVQKDLRLLAGTLDLQGYTMNSVVAGTGIFQMADNTMLRVGSTNDLSNTVNNYQTYNIATLSIVHFNGTNQIVSNLPLNLTQNFITNTGGLGTVWLSNSGTKVVNNPLLIRGNLVTFSGITLQNSSGVDALAVRGNVINNATLYNEGVIEIGICP